MDWIGNEEQIDKIVKLMKDQFPDFHSGHDVILEARKYIGHRHLHKQLANNKNSHEYNKFNLYWMPGAKDNPETYKSSWCAMFNTFVFDKPGHNLGRIKNENRRGYAYVREGYHFWKDKGELTNYPVPGDIVLYTLHKLTDKGEKETHHTGIFVCWENFPHGNTYPSDPNLIKTCSENHDYFYTIEGNTSGPYVNIASEHAGGSVAMKRRSVNKDGAYFAHPKQAYEATPPLVDYKKDPQKLNISDPIVILNDGKTKELIVDKQNSMAKPGSKVGSTVNTCLNNVPKEANSKKKDKPCNFDTVSISATNNHKLMPVYKNDLDKDKILKVVSGYSKNNASEITFELDGSCDSCQEGHNNNDNNIVFDLFLGEPQDKEVKLILEQSLNKLKIKTPSLTHSFDMNEDFDFNVVNKIFEDKSKFRIVQYNEQNFNWIPTENQIINICRCSQSLPLRVIVYPDTKWSGFQVESIMKNKRLDEIKISANFKEDNEQSACNISLTAKHDYFFKINTAGDSTSDIVSDEKSYEQKLDDNIKNALLERIKEIFKITDVIPFVQDIINEMGNGYEPVKVEMNSPQININNGNWQWKEFESKNCRNDCGFEFKMEICVEKFISFGDNCYIDFIKYDRKSDDSHDIQENSIIQKTSDIDRKGNTLNFIKAGSTDDENLQIGREVYRQLTSEEPVLRIALNNPANLPSPFLKFSVEKVHSEKYFKILQGGSTYFIDETTYKNESPPSTKGETITINIPLEVGYYINSPLSNHIITLIDCLGYGEKGKEPVSGFSFSLTPVVDKRGVYLEYNYYFTGLKLENNAYSNLQTDLKNSLSHRKKHSRDNIKQKWHGGKPMSGEIFIVKF